MNETSPWATHSLPTEENDVERGIGAHSLAHTHARNEMCV